MAASTGPLRIGGNGIWGEWFAGLIDEVRVYNRALGATEIQQDLQRPVTGTAPPPPPPPTDTTPPTAPTALTSSVSNGTVTLSWSAATDVVGVTRYNVHRSTTAGFTPAAANRIGQPTSTGYTDPGLAPGTYYYRVTAEDAAGNIGPPSAEATAVVPRRRHRRRRRPGSWRRTGSTPAPARRSPIRRVAETAARVSGATWSSSGRFGVGVELRRRQRLGDDPGFGLARSLVRDDGRGVGAAVPARRLAHGGGEGAIRRARVRGVRRPGGRAAAGAGGHRRRAERRRDGVAAAECVVASGDDVRRCGRAALRERGAGGLVCRSSGSMAASTGVVAARRQRRLGEWFAGLIDEVRVYNRALSASEIQQDMQTPIG